MASKKDKFLESAQRFVLKGQLDRAIKDYQQVVALEPKEIRYRQRLAELLVRDSRKEEAIAQYEGIGKHYAENSYFLKAIAVYKQIQRLAPEDRAISLTLASLNNQQGLTGNALAEYAQVVAQMEKDGALKEAISVLEKMLAIDGEPAATRLKYAELLFATGDEATSFQAFSALLTSLRAAGDGAAVQRLSERMRQLFPENKEHDAASIAPRLAAEEPDDSAVMQELPQSDSADLPAATGQSAQTVATKPNAFEPSVTMMETPSAFGPASIEAGTPAVTEAPSAFGTPWQSDAPGTSHAAKVTEASELASPWEEEIELDLDDDSHDTLPAAVPDIALLLDFSLPLEFDEGEHFDQSLSANDEPVDTEISFPVAGSSPFGEFPELAGDSPFSEASLFAEASPFAEGPVSDASCFSDSLATGEKEIGVVELDLEVDLPLDLAWPDETEIFTEAALAVGAAESNAAEAAAAEAAAAEAAAAEAAAAEAAAAEAAAAEAAAVEAAAVEAAAVEAAAVEAAAVEAAAVEAAAVEAAAVEAAAVEAAAVEAAAIAAAEEIAAAQEAAQTRQLRGWQEIFPDSLSSAEVAIDSEELESHYDLGIAFKEMGRYGDAIKEFTVAAGNPRRRLDCLTLQAVCCREMGETGKAEDLLQLGRSLEVLSVEERMILGYELAFLFETTGNLDGAIGLYREVHEVDPAFHDVAHRLSSLAGEEPLDIIELELEEDEY